MTKSMRLLTKIMTDQLSILIQIGSSRAKILRRKPSITVECVEISIGNVILWNLVVPVTISDKLSLKIYDPIETALNIVERRVFD